MPPTNQSRTSRPLRVAYFDGAVAYGGSLQVLSMLFGALDRNAVTPSLIACVPPRQLQNKFDECDVGLLCHARLSYVDRERWMQQLQRHGGLIRRIGAYLFTIAAAMAALPNQLRLFFHLYKARPDLIHVNNSFTPLLAAHLLGIPVVWHLHGIPFHPSPWERLLLRKVRRFIAISDYVARAAIAAGYPAERMITIHNPAPDFQPPEHDVRQELLERYGIPTDHLLVAHVGRLIRWKGQKEFLEAFALALESYPKATALIIGDDAESFGDSYAKELKKLVADRGLTQNVIFTGHLDQIQNVMAAVDIVVHSSIEPEPFGLVIVEAMKAGALVIASDLGAPREIVRHESTGYLCSPNCQATLAQTLIDALRNDAQRLEVALRGMAEADKRYNLIYYSTTMSNIYHNAAPLTPKKKT